MMKDFTTLPLYQSHKIVGAAKIFSIDILYKPGTTEVESAVFSFTGNGHPPPRTYTGEQLAKKPSPQAGWYLVEYDGGYFSFSPAEQFEEGYYALSNAEPTENMNFGDALDALKSKMLVCREGWNGKGMFLFLVPGSTFTVNRAPLLGIVPEGTVIDYNPHIDIKSVDGKVTPWVASQTDLMATDWMLVNP